MSVGRALRSSAVLSLGGRGVLPDALQHLRQGGLVHGQQTLGAHAFQNAGDSGIVEHQPVVLRRNVDVAKADLFGREPKFGSAVRSLALFDEALLVQK